MFWRFGGYASISTIDTLLEKPDTTLEELLDDADLLQELKQHNAKLIEYLREDHVLHRLLRYVVASSSPEPAGGGTGHGGPGSPEPGSTSRSEGDSPFARTAPASELTDEERQKEERTRHKYATTACEILSSETRSITDTIMEHHDYLREFWRCLESDLPLDPMVAGFFAKVNECLLDRKTEEMLAFIKTMEDVVWHMLRHVDCPVVMDLLLKIISLEGAEGGQGIVDWLHTRNLVPILLSYLSPEHPSSTQTAAGDFLKAVITISANASQNEQSCIGPNSLTRQLVSETCIGKLIKDMLRGGCALTVGVGVIIEVIRKNNSDYDPDIAVGLNTLPSSKDPIYLGTLLRMFAEAIPDFMAFILHKGKGGQRRTLPIASGDVIEPLGFDRFKTCELMAELLHCSNMGLLNEPGSDVYMRKRDDDRERLRAEGRLPHERDAQTQPTEFVQAYQQDADSNDRTENSFDEHRRLEVSNPTEDDGFEDIVISDELDEDAREDRGKPSDGQQHLEATTSVAGRLSEFSAARASGDDTTGQPAAASRGDAQGEGDTTDAGALKDTTSPDPSPRPPSPASHLTRELERSHLRDTGGVVPDPTPAVNAGEELARAGPSSHLLKVQPMPPATDDAPPSPSQCPLPMSPPPTPAGYPSKSDQMSPHPEDHPAPLFSRAFEAGPPQPARGDETGVESRTEDDNGTESVGTAFGTEGDSVRSELASGTEKGPNSGFETEPDSSPVVGDHLKMMFVEHRVVPTILDFFFRFPWNNFLHNVVYDVVQQVFNGSIDRGYNRTLAVDLFERGRITELIIHGQSKSDKAQELTNTRLGYMGHLTLIAEEVVKFAERHPPDFLSDSVLEMVMASEWIEYVEHSLADTRERDNAILGGVRPDVSVGARQAVMNSLNAGQNFGNGPSTVLASAGLTGGPAGLDTVDLIHGNGNPNETFSFGNNSLLSGLGASDEDDEDMEETDEGRSMKNEQMDREAFDEHASIIHSSPQEITSETQARSDIPRIPPPPPPLNIPPSRARRQLAARLAMKLKAKQQEQRLGAFHASGEEGVDGGSTSGYGGYRGSTFDLDAQDGEDEPWASHRSRLRSSTLSSSSSSSSSSSTDEDDDDLTLAPPPMPVGPGRSHSGAVHTRSILESEDDEYEEGEVVDLGNGDNDGMSSEDSGDLVEIQTTRRTEPPGEEYRAHQGLTGS